MSSPNLTEYLDPPRGASESLLLEVRGSSLHWKGNSVSKHYLGSGLAPEQVRDVYEWVTHEDS